MAEVCCADLMCINSLLLTLFQVSEVGRLNHEFITSEKLFYIVYICIYYYRFLLLTTAMTLPLESVFNLSLPSHIPHFKIFKLQKLARFYFFETSKSV